MSLLTESAVAEMLGVKVSTLTTWRSGDVGPTYVRLGRNTIRYRPEDVDAYIEERRKATLSVR